MLITALRNVIDADTANDPDCIKGRKKTVQVSKFLLFLSFNITEQSRMKALGVSIRRELTDGMKIYGIFARNDKKQTRFTFNIK